MPMLSNLMDGAAAEPFGRAAEPSRPLARVPAGWMAVVMTVLIGGFASCVVACAIATADQRAAEIAFADEAAQMRQRIQAAFAETADTLLSLRDFMAATGDPGRQEFQDFARRLRARSVALRDTGWAPYVGQAEREAFETAARQSGLAGFQIREPDAAHALAAAPMRPRYFPIFFPDPAEIAPEVMGINLDFEPVRQEAISRALASGDVAATPPMRLITVDRDFSGFMSFATVPRAGFPGEHPDGLVYGVFEIAPMLEAAIAAHVADPDVSTLFFRRDEGERTILWHQASDLEGLSHAEPSAAAARRQPHWEGDLLLGGQRWGVLFIPAHGVGAGPLDRPAIAMLLAGLLMTGVVAAYVAGSKRKNDTLVALNESLGRTMRELTSQREKLSHMAWHDTLTGLLNRAALNRTLERLLTASERRPFAFILMDLDGFKRVNDEFGHLVGDELLIEVARRFRRLVGEMRQVARLGGDEFAVILDDVSDPGDAGRFCAAVIDGVAQAFPLNGQAIRVGVSLGVAMVGRGATSAKAVLHRADNALYAAKASGRGIYKVDACGDVRRASRDRGRPPPRADEPSGDQKR